MKHWKFAKEVLRELSLEYGIPCPRLKLGFSEVGRYSAIFQEFDETIYVKKEVLQSQSETLATMRHEFAHYWEYFTGLKYSERRAKKFEKPNSQLALPNGQKSLLRFISEVGVSPKK